ncbi:short tail fibers protein [Aeromonas phage Aswh_1]|nr:short tail fibers protein [Aeromonas phage Aswh_1]
MINNTEQHISSKAVDVELDPSTTNFPPDTTDVQKMANLIQPHAIGNYEDMKATETKMGILRIATEQEVLDGLVPDAIVTPKTLQAKWVRPDASETVKGLVRFANSSERNEANASTSIGIHTSGIWDIIRNKAGGSTTKSGTLKLSTVAVGVLGLDSTTATTPAVVKAMIDTFAITTNPAGATETTSGVVKISPSPVVNAGLHNGVAVSPKGFIETRATTTRVGTTRMATQAEANARALSDVALSPATLPIGSTQQYGIVALSNVPVDGLFSHALTAHGAAQLMPKTGGAFTGPISAPSMYISSQVSNPDAVTRRDFVEGLFNSLNSVIATKTSKGSRVNFTSSERTILFDASGQGGLPTGNFWLSQPWWDFDSLIFEATGDSGREMTSYQMTRQQIINAQDYYYTYGYWVVHADSIWWLGRFDPNNGRFFQTIGENCRMWRVWGIKDVYTTT